jgi:hypothetical protein
MNGVFPINRKGGPPPMEIKIIPNQVAQSNFLTDFTSKECLYLSGFGGG